MICARTVALLLSSSALLMACSPQPRKANTLDESELHTPRTIAANDYLIPGCCSMNTGRWSAERHMSDSFAVTLSGPDATVEVVYGAYDTGVDRREAISREIDGIEVLATSPSRAGNVETWTVSAEVPPSERGKAVNLRPYTLRMTAECDTSQGCAAARALLASLRF